MRNLKKTIKSYWFLLRFYLYIFVVLIPKIPYFKYLTKKGRIGERTEKVFKAVQKWADYTVKIGKSNRPYNNALTAMLDLSTTHLIGPEHVIGLIAGAGIGLGGNGKSPDFVWDVRGGIVIYFLQWNWL